MSKQEMEVAAKKLQNHYSQFPDWYWKYGLHDAMILSICELEFSPDWKEKHPKRNCLEILLDGKNALYEANIQRISLYNYRIIDIKMNATEPIALDTFQSVYWLGDSIEQLREGRYLLEIECTDLQGNLMYLTVQFETAEIIGGNMATIQKADYIFSVDVEKTIDYYKSYSLCECDYCENFYAQIKGKFPKHESFLTVFGVDISKPDELRFAKWQAF